MLYSPLSPQRYVAQFGDWLRESHACTLVRISLNHASSTRYVRLPFTGDCLYLARNRSHLGRPYVLHLNMYNLLTSITSN